MIVSRVLAYALAGMTVVAAVGWGWGWKQHQDERVARAEGEVAVTGQQVAVQATQNCTAYAAQVRAIQAECAAERKRLVGENQAAVKAAYDQGIAAGVERERYQRQLADAAGDPECQEILTARVCPRLFPY